MSDEAAAQRIGLPVLIKTLSDGIALALDTDVDRAHAAAEPVRGRSSSCVPG
jgi:hypothetical protein